MTSGKLDIGAVRSLRVDVVSETGWFDNVQFGADMAAAGSPTSQYEVPWTAENAGGYSALLTITTLEGNERRILLDTGWNNDWMNEAYEKLGIPGMLRRGEVELLVISHWHLDHFWGIQSTLEHAQKLTILAPETYFPEDIALVREKTSFTCRDPAGSERLLARNDVPHRGELLLTSPSGPRGDGFHRLMDGVVLKMFDVPIMLRVRGENVIYVHVQDKGIVTVTGCGHPGVVPLLSTAGSAFQGARPYGCYGGLHLTPFERWDDKLDDVTEYVRSLQLAKVAANHCTGWLWAERAATAGIPIVRGTGKAEEYRRRSTGARDTHAYLGNGDSVTF